MNRIYEVTDFPITPDTLMLQETLFHNANGYIGVRGALEEGLPEGMDTMRGMYVNGFYDIVPMKQAEKLCNLVEDKEAMLNAADTQTIRFAFGGEMFSMFEGEVLHITRTLDMDSGTATRVVHWRSPQGKEARLSFCRMTSFAQPSLFTIDCSVTPLNFSGEVTVESYHTGLVKNYANPNDPRLSAESGSYLVAVSSQHTDTASSLLTGTVTSGLTLCTAVAHTFSRPCTAHSQYDKEKHEVKFTFGTWLAQGETLGMVKYTVFADSLRGSTCAKTADEEMAKAVGQIALRYQEQREYLANFWMQSEVKIEGDDEADRSVCFNLYQLLQSSGKDGFCSIAAKGLSGEGYEGHYFWDTEMYMLPFFTLTNPKLARQLLSYRYNILDAARENARLLGHKKGALYPWRTIHGKECSGYFPSGTAQYHINGAVAYAVVSYYLATGDTDFLLQYGGEILIETARLWNDVGSWYNGSFRINDVTGPDEYTCIVNNNYYTNACAKFNLEWAVKSVEIMRLGGSGGAEKLIERLALTKDEIAQFTKAADNIYLPYDQTLGINPQDDSFLEKPIWDIAGTPKENFPLLMHYHPLCIYRYQVCKQADTVLAYFVFDGLADRDVMLRSFEYYEKVTTHDSSLSTCVFSIVASQLGLREKAWKYFGNSLETDLMNTHNNTKDGIHTANIGGCYMSMVNGFAGLRINEERMLLSPYLPGNWSGYSFKVRYRGSLIKVEVRRGSCLLTLITGAPVPVSLYGKALTLATTLEASDVSGGRYEL